MYNASVMQKMDSGMTVRGHVVAVTGGGSGIGRELCLLAAREGAKAVVAIDYSEKAAQETAALAKADCTAIGIRADCGKEEDLTSAIDRVEREVGPIGLFVANAGIGDPGGVSASNDRWASIMGVNLYQHVYWARHLVPKMIARGGGYIVVTSSAAGLLTQVGSLSYAVTKAAAISVAEWVAITHGDDGIGVSCLCPQAVDTNLFKTSAAYSKGTSVKSSAKDAGSPGGVAGGDGILSAQEVAAETLRCVREGEFLVLPHKEVLQYSVRKAQDRSRWIKGMRRLNKVFGQEAAAEARPAAKL